MSVKKPHIQMPKCIMARFSHRNDHVDGKKQAESVYALLLDDYSIVEKPINELGTGEEGYYSNELECYFAEYEAKFGGIQKQVNEFAKRYGKKTHYELSIDEDSILFVRKFMGIILLRSEFLFNHFNTNNVFNPAFKNGLNKADISDLIKNTENSEHLEQSHIFSILINCTNKEFIAPRNVIYADKNECLIMPISPKSAIIVLPVEEAKKYGASFTTSRFMIASKETIVYEFNQFAFFAEEICNNSFLIASRKDELVEIREYALQRKVDIKQ